MLDIAAIRRKATERELSEAWKRYHWCESHLRAIAYDEIGLAVLKIEIQDAQAMINKAVWKKERGL